MIKIKSIEFFDDGVREIGTKDLTNFQVISNSCVNFVFSKSPSFKLSFLSDVRKIFLLDKDGKLVLNISYFDGTVEKFDIEGDKLCYYSR